MAPELARVYIWLCWSFTACVLNGKPLFACNNIAVSSMYIVICYLNAVRCIWTNFCDVLFMNRLVSQSKAKVLAIQQAKVHHTNQLFTWTLTCSTHWGDLMDWFLWQSSCFLTILNYYSSGIKTEHLRIPPIAGQLVRPKIFFIYLALTTHMNSGLVT